MNTTLREATFYWLNLLGTLQKGLSEDPENMTEVMQLHSLDPNSVQTTLKAELEIPRFGSENQ